MIFFYLLFFSTPLLSRTNSDGVSTADSSNPPTYHEATGLPTYEEATKNQKNDTDELKRHHEITKKYLLAFVFFLVIISILMIRFVHINFSYGCLVCMFVLAMTYTFL
ncbi:hypothetical protein NGRA_1311 [Nosema granulosis]|uniref:Uncharacterized protein n=1 Tax=Nosema granulosis TaxID=83296 RepID=A0A9P6GYN0_9MICR|nr:hypothetical protein NGRA_1311 [Nosema granulosis]